MLYNKFVKSKYLIFDVHSKYNNKLGQIYVAICGNNIIFAEIN